MSREAIKILKAANAYASLEDCICKAIEVLESEPPAGEFTKRARRIATHEPHKTRNTFERTILEACDIIDRLEATIQRMDTKAEEMDKNYGRMVLERDRLEAENKELVEETAVLATELSELKEQLQATLQAKDEALLTYGRHIPSCLYAPHIMGCTCGWQDVKRQAKQALKEATDGHEKEKT
jgi:regulator of replication initiation timing